MSLVKTPEQRQWTYQDYLQLGDETRCEIVGGELLMTPSPELDHQEVSRNLEFAMWQYVKEKALGKVFYAPVDVILDEENVVQPDIVFVSEANAKILHKKGIMGSPDLVVEILSPTSIHRDRHQKRELYQRFAVPEYWIVDPSYRAIEVFALEQGRYELFSFGVEKGKVKSRVISGFEPEISEIMP